MVLGSSLRLDNRVCNRVLSARHEDMPGLGESPMGLSWAVQPCTYSCFKSLLLAPDKKLVLPLSSLVGYTHPG